MDVDKGGAGALDGELAPINDKAVPASATLIDYRVARLVGIAAGILLALWLLLPALTPAHVEGFSAAVAALGLHMTHGTLAYFDQLEPLNTEYFGLTKLGMVISLAGVTAALPVTADLAFRLLMWGGMVLFLLSSGLLVRRWSGASWPAVIAPLVIMPGVFESAFIFSDNVLAAALAACSLCLLYARRLPTIALSGFLFGGAVLTRTDSVLIAAAFPIILIERFGFTRRAVIALTLAAASGSIVLFGTLAWFNASPMDIIRVGSAAVTAWDRPLSAGISLAVLAFYLGLGGICLVVLGAGSVLRGKQVLAIIRLLLPPAIVLLILRQSLWETRQLLALTPFFGTLATIGLGIVFAPAKTSGQRLTRTAVITLAALSLFGPVTGKGFADGPRAFTGRAWNIPAVLTWQDGSRRDVAALDNLIVRLGEVPRVTLIANSWDEDRYLHLSLLDHDYDLTPRSLLPDVCRQAVDHYERGNSQVVIVRNYQSFVPYAQGLAADRFELRSLPCVQVLGGTPQILVSEAEFLDSVPASVFADPAARSPFDDPRAQGEVHELTFRQVRDLAIDRAAAAQLLSSYRRETVDYKERIGPERDQKWSSRTIADANDATRARTSFAGTIRP